MRTRELIRVLPTQYKRTTENPLYTGHFIPLLGHWTETEGFVKNQSLDYDDEVLACPIIAVVETKIGKKDCVLNITGKVAQYNDTSSRTEEDYTVSRKRYEDSGTTIVGTLTVPRFTRPMATFLITGLGKSIWDIQSITTTVTNNIGKINFYALASNGSKIIYWFGIHKYATQLREILRPWIAPSKCSRCSGTGIEPNATTDCLQCLGYKYSGYSAISYGQKQIGFDIGLARELLDWDDMSDADHEIVRKFINKCWTQKWWCTPTKKEIRRLFSHFYDISEEAVYITERFNPQEPVWRISLPEQGSTASAFGTFEQSDRNLMEYIAESVTPAGVSVFVGFYREYYLGGLDDFETGHVALPFFREARSSAFEHYLELWGEPRWDFWNGHVEASEDFERETALGWEEGGTVGIVNVNDQNKHMCRFTDNSYIATGTTEATGYMDLWVHPQETEFRAGIINGSGDWMFYVKYDTDGFYDHNNVLLTNAVKDNDYHLSIDFDHTLEEYRVQIMQEQFGTGWISYLNGGTQDKIKFESIGTGNVYIDGIGLPDDINYTKNENYSRLYKVGFGIDNLDYADGVTGTVSDLWAKYFMNDMFFNLNI